MFITFINVHNSNFQRQKYFLLTYFLVIYAVFAVSLCISLCSEAEDERLGRLPLGRLPLHHARKQEGKYITLENSQKKI